MRIFPLAIASLFCRVVFAASTYWTGVSVMNDGSYQGGAYAYWFGGDIYGENNTHAWIFSSMYGHVENGDFYLKHQDFSKESMEPTYNWWALALYGDVVSEATFDSLTHVEDTYIHDPNVPLVGGTQVGNPSDFYMVFKASEVLFENHEYVEGMTWYGWVHVSLDDNLNMTLLGEGINLTGGEVTVGVTPEPSAALLLLVGGALLALRRRRGGPGGGPVRCRHCRHDGFDAGENDG